MSALTRIKFCGITNVEDATAAANLGIDAIGINFYSASPRCVSLETANEIIAALPPFITTVGIFVDPMPLEMETILASVALDLLQFHGNETAEECERYDKPYIKAIAFAPDTNLNKLAQEFVAAKGLLLDACIPGQKGGTGMTFDWAQIPKNISKPIILSGGLTPANVHQAITMVQPYAVDVASGIESALGKKDAAKMQAFVNAVRHDVVI